MTTRIPATARCSIRAKPSLLVRVFLMTAVWHSAATANDDDFAQLNELLGNVQGIRIPLPPGGFQLGDGGVSVTLKSAVCSRFAIDDISLTTPTFSNSGPTATTTNVNLDIQGLDFQCVFDYSYSFLFTRSGQAILDSRGNEARLQLEIMAHRPNVFANNNNNINQPPTAMQIEDCTASVQLTNLDVNGSISAVVLETVVRLLRNSIEQATGKFLCDQLQAWASDSLAEELQTLDTTLARYYPPIFRQADMLSSEKEFANNASPPAGTKIISFNPNGGDSNKPVAEKWLDEMVAMLNDFLVKPTPKAEGSTELDLNVNVLLRDHILAANGGFVVDFATPLAILEQRDRLTRTKVALHGIQVLGLDRIQSLGPLQIVGNQTIQTALTIEDVQVELDLSIDVLPSLRPDSYVVNPTLENVVKERITISFGIEDFRGEMALFMAMNQTSLGLLRFGSLLNVGSIVPCLLSTLMTAQIGGLTVHTSNIRRPTLRGFVAPGIDRLVTKTVETIFQVYMPVLREALPGLFHLFVRPKVNDQLGKQILPKLNRHCPGIVGHENASEFIDFRDLLLPPQEALSAGATGLEPYGDVVHRIFSLVTAKLSEKDATGSPKINSLIRSMVRSMSNDTSDEHRDILRVGDVFSTSTLVEIAGFKATASFAINEAEVENLDSFSTFELLQPVKDQANIINSTVIVGTAYKPLRAEGSLKLNIFDGKGVNFDNVVRVRLDLGSLLGILVIFAQIMEKPLLSVHLKDMRNINCWIAAAIPSSSEDSPIMILERDLTVDSLFLNVTCVSCSSPNLVDFVYQLYSAENSGNVTGSLQNIMGLVIGSDYIANLNEGIYAMAARQCPSNPQFDSSSSYRDFFLNGGDGSPLVRLDRDSYAQMFNVANVIVAVIVLTFHFVIRRIIGLHFNRWREAASPTTLDELHREQKIRERKAKETNDRSSSMFLASCLPKRVRYGFPLALAVTIVVQLVGHFALLSTVDLNGRIAGQSFEVKSFLEFAFFKALSRTAGNGGREMAVLAFVFTGVWPYVKLFLCVALWVLPPSKVSVQKREKILLWLDVFAKLSVVDVLTLLMAVGALLVYLGGLDESLSQDSSFELKAIVHPGWGCYCIVMAQRVLRVSSRYMLDCHEKMVALQDPWTSAQDQSNDTFTTLDSEDDLVSHTSEHPERGGFSPLAVFAGLTVALIGITGACLAPAMSIDTRSVWGIVGSGRTFEEAVETLPLFHVITEVLTKSRMVLSSVADYVGLGFLLSLVVIATTAVPFMRLVTFVRKWRQTDSPRTSMRDLLQRSASTGLEKIKSGISKLRKPSVATPPQFLAYYKLEAYRQLEVFVATFILSCWQLGAVSAYAIHMYCFVLETLYRSVERIGLIATTSAQCYQTQATDPSTLAILFLGFLSLLVTFLWSAHAHYHKFLQAACRASENVSLLMSPEHDNDSGSEIDDHHETEPAANQIAERKE